jgi:hypothetical protein
MSKSVHATKRDVICGGKLLSHNCGSTVVNQIA